MTAKASAYVPSLDGVRALAVAAVLVYHAQPGWLPAGFLGVDVFFVLSGYLITSILLSEQQRGGIDLKAFWLRRARRLLPALYLLIGVTLTYAVLALPSEVASLRFDALAALGYVTNWYLILQDQSYFEAIGRPSLLKHLWSLAVEEQFYLLWPLVLTLGLRRWSGRTMLIVALGGVALSTALMAALYRPDLDPSRVYFGTDTRVSALLVGAALAFVWPRGRDRRWLYGVRGWIVGKGFNLVGIAALVALALCAFRLSQFSPMLYQGGFTLIALLTAALIAACMHPAAHLTALLGRQPLRWLGLRSYGVYLWHWPVYMVTRAELDVPLEGLPLLALRLGATALLAELSYRLVEAPIRGGALERAWVRLRAPTHPGDGRFVARWAVGTVALIVGITLLGAAAAAARPPETPAYLAVESVDTFRSSRVRTSPPEPAPIATPPPKPMQSTATDAAAAPSPSVAPLRLVAGPLPPALARLPMLPVSNPAASSLDQSLSEADQARSVNWSPVLVARLLPFLPGLTSQDRSAPSFGVSARSVGTVGASLDGTTAQAARATSGPPEEPSPATTVAPTPEDAPTVAPTPTPPMRVTALGDSVMLGAVDAMLGTFDDIQIDAAVSRQVFTVIERLQYHLEAGEVGEVVVLHIGNNGTLSVEQFDTIMGLLRNTPRVIFLNLRVYREWEASNNAIILDGVQRYPNAVLLNWRAASRGHAEWFWDDGIHLRPEGGAVYARLIQEAVNAP